MPQATLKKVYGIQGNQNEKNFIKKIIEIKKKKQINLFALHCFSDCPHSCGNILFKDFYYQFLQTIKFLRNNNTNGYWIIKPHPARSTYNEIGIVEEIINRYKNELNNVVICPKNVDNLTIFQLTDNLINNGVSTISLEFACYGKKSIISGDAPYLYKNLFYKPRNKNAYFSLLKKLHKLNNRLSNQQIILSKRMLYILENSINTNLDKTKILPDLNLKEYSNNQNYIKKLNSNMSKIKSGTILNDPLFKDLKTKLSKLII